jgi:hypothetical protein
MALALRGECAMLATLAVLYGLAYVVYRATVYRP